MTNPPDRAATTVLRLATPAELLAALPALLGFAPHRSVVVIGLHGRGAVPRVGTIARVDLPATPEDVVALADVVVRRFAGDEATDVQLVVVADDPVDGHGPPHREVLDAFRDGFILAGFGCSSPLWCSEPGLGGRWLCYDRCRCGGTLPDPASSPVAAAQTVLSGRVTYRSREDAEAALAPDPDAELHRRPELLQRAHRVRCSSTTTDRHGAVGADLSRIRAAVATVGRGETVSVEAQAAIVVALRDPAVRDLCAGFGAGADPDLDPADVQRLWWLLTRSTPAPEVADPATLLALTYPEGGPILTIALERARRADPVHGLSRLLDLILQSGVGPAAVTEMLRSVTGVPTADARPGPGPR